MNYLNDTVETDQIKSTTKNFFFVFNYKTQKASFEFSNKIEWGRKYIRKCYASEIVQIDTVRILLGRDIVLLCLSRFGRKQWSQARKRERERERERDWFVYFVCFVF